MSRQGVRDSNNLAYLLAALMTFCWSRRIIFILEQPFQSFLADYAPIKKFLVTAKASKIKCYLGAFGGELGIPKPVQLWSNACYLRRLLRPMPEKTLEQRQPYYSTTLDDYTGGQSLRSSGAYPREFGVAVVDTHISFGHRQSLPEQNEAWNYGHRSTCQAWLIFIVFVFAFPPISDYAPGCRNWRWRT